MAVHNHHQPLCHSQEEEEEEVEEGMRGNRVIEKLCNVIYWQKFKCAEIDNLHNNQLVKE